MSPGQAVEMLNLLREIRDLLKGAQPEPVIPPQISGGAADGRNGPVTVTNQRQSQYTMTDWEYVPDSDGYM